MTRVIHRVNVSVSVGDPRRVAEFHVERRKPGFANEIYGLFLRGRIRAAAGRLQSLRFSCCNRMLDELVLESGGRSWFGLIGDSGTRNFELGLNLLGAPPEAKIGMEASFSSGSAVPLGTIEISRTRLDSGYEPKYNPIILNSMGRSGTTVFMRMLSLHPRIYVHHEYPHELLAAHYWINLLESLSMPQAGQRLTGKWNMRNLRHRVVTSSPYYRLGVSAACARYLGGEYVARLARFCQENVDGIYAALIRQDQRVKSGEMSPDFAFFAEKSLPLPALIREVYPRAKEIYLVRDIRDGICSALSFNRKRGTPAFGRESVSSNVRFAEQRADEFQGLYSRYESSAYDRCLVRYEDLIRAPEAELARILGYLGLDATAGDVSKMAQQPFAGDGKLDFHRTSTSPLASIGRWERELPPKLRAVCAQRAGRALEQLGYAS
jgi:hypothetical protein